MRHVATTLALLLTTGCALHSTATEWNHRIGEDGKPVFYTSTTKVGARFLIVVPFLGRLGIDGLVNDMTAEIAAKDGDHVRIVQGSTENYWYGFPPLTWIVTPVVSTLTAEYQPSEDELIGALVELRRNEHPKADAEELHAMALEDLEAWSRDD